MNPEFSHIRFLINPISGRHPNADKIISEINGFFAGKNKEHSITISKYGGHLAQLAAEAAEDGVDVVVAVGGDGTVNEVAGALLGSDSALGIIPNGSGNGLARHLGISMNVQAALDVIMSGNIVRIDHGRVGGKPFFCTMGVGFDAKVGMDYSQSGHRGLITYAGKALHGIAGYKPKMYALDIDGETKSMHAALVTVANANQWGNGFHIAPGASVMDGRLDITVLKTFESIHLLDMPVQTLGYSIDRNPAVMTFQGQKITLTALESDYCHLDGEPYSIKEGTTLNIDVCPKDLAVIVPCSSAISRPL